MSTVTRARSFWGWGWADKFPDDATRKGLASYAGSVLGTGELALRTPPTLDAISLPPPRVVAPTTLADRASSAPFDRASHTYGKSYRDVARGFGGDFAAAPDLVLYPDSEAAVIDALDWCAAERVAVIPFGGGTSVVGGVEGGAVRDRFRGVASLDLRGLDGVLEIDPISRSARIAAGIMGPALEAQLAPHGFTLRHFPQSFEFSTLGGWIATRAGGHFATLYTHIDDLTQAVRMVTPTGIWQSPRLPASGAGPSPDRLALGSEGILGVITEAWMRLQLRPRWRASASVKYREFTAAVASARDLAQSGLYPSNCRLLDAREAMLHRVATDGTAVLLIGFESADHPLEPWMARALEIARGHGGLCDGARFRDTATDAAAGAGTDAGRAAEAELWRGAFLEAPYLLNAMVSIGVVVDTFETACTWDRFDALHRGVIQDVRAAMKRECGGGVISCRFSHVYPDGPAPYYTFIAPGRPGAELAQWEAIKRAASDALAAHGGTITHHHAVGRMHRPWYDRERPAPFAAALTAAKRALDPAGVLNPGVLIDL